MAFAVSRYSWRLNITLLIVFTAGNMLPPQVLAAPVFQMYKHVTLPYSVSDSGSLLNTYYGVIAINVAFQMGFCTFVMSNYMKALPQDLTEAALVDGAGVWRQYAQIIMPLCRPALAALATLEVIWVYNDFFWPLLLIQTGDRLPVTTAINNLKGQFLDNYNLISAGATDHRDPRPDRLPGAATAIRRRPDSRRQQGLAALSELLSSFAPGAGRRSPRARMHTDARAFDLNGTWCFRWAERADAVDAATWGELSVPAHWQLNGYGEPAYTNVRYPFPVDPPHVPDANPTGEYLRTFDLDADWPDGAAVLRFDGVDSAFRVWLNDTELGVVHRQPAHHRVRRRAPAAPRREHAAGAGAPVVVVELSRGPGHVVAVRDLPRRRAARAAD